MKLTYVGIVMTLGTLSYAATSEIADAAMRKNREAVAALIAKKADVNAPQTDGATALHWAVYNDDLQMADMLLRAGANAQVANREGATVLSLASINGDAAMIDKLLAAGADSNESLPNGETPLMMASRTGNVQAMQTLLDHKAEVNAKEKLRGTTALLWAASEAHPEALQFLLEHGADVQAASSAVIQSGARPNVAPTAVQRATQDVNSADAAAARLNQGKQARNRNAPAEGGDDAVGQVRNGFAVQPRVGAMTALMFAARQGDLTSVELLLNAGADLNQQSVDGWTPLNLATQKMGKYLLEHGANPNLANRQGWSPLYLARDNRNIEAGCSG